MRWRAWLGWDSWISWQRRSLEKTMELDRKYTEEQSQGVFHRNMKLNLKSLCLTSLILLLMNCTASSTSNPTPTPWPEQFHALLYMNLSDARLQLSDLWYDWPGGRNVNIFTRQLIGDILYDVEWDNGTSYYFTLGENPTCMVREFEVGIPRPDFLYDANYLGTQVTDGFLCHVWEKVDFIWYYEDVITKRPVRWDFFDGISSHVIAYEVGAVLPDSVTQAPAHCFNQDNHKSIATSFNNFRPSDFDLIK